jgi:hypothetical protein
MDRERGEEEGPVGPAISILAVWVSFAALTVSIHFRRMPNRANTNEQDWGRSFVSDIVLNSVKILDIGEKQAQCIPAFMLRTSR